MAREQDRESDRMAIQAETESQRRQMLRCVDTYAHDYHRLSKGSINTLMVWNVTWMQKCLKPPFFLIASRLKLICVPCKNLTLVIAYCYFSWSWLWVCYVSYCSNQTAWRKANLACKLSIDNMEKDELLHGGETQSLRQRLVQLKLAESQVGGRNLTWHYKFVMSKSIYNLIRDEHWC